MFPFFFKKNFFFNYLRSAYNLYRNIIITNSNQRAKRFFKKIHLYDELKLSKDNWNANFSDLRFLYEFVIYKKISTILEFGTGFSTIVMASALKFNSNYKKNNKIFTLETEKKWIIPVKKN